MHSAYFTLLTALALLGHAVLGCECHAAGHHEHAENNEIATSPVLFTGAVAVLGQSSDADGHAEHPECVYRLDPSPTVPLGSQVILPQFATALDIGWLNFGENQPRGCDGRFLTNSRATAARAWLQLWTV